MTVDKHDKLKPARLPIPLGKKSSFATAPKAAAGQPSLEWDGDVNQQFEGAKVDDMVLFQESGPITSLSEDGLVKMPLAFLSSHSSQ